MKKQLLKLKLNGGLPKLRQFYQASTAGDLQEYSQNPQAFLDELSIIPKHEFQFSAGYRKLATALNTLDIDSLKNGHCENENDGREKAAARVTVVVTMTSGIELSVTSQSKKDLETLVASAQSAAEQIGWFS